MEINIRKAEVYKMTAIIGASIIAENGYIVSIHYSTAQINITGWTTYTVTD